jgi:sterol desaturase/sphingolipid hydroxylase (fatty acid hydroxylase superfamily)
MPSPIDILFDPISLASLAIYAALMLWERSAPGRVLPDIQGWRARGVASFVAYFYLASYLPLLWDETLVQYRLLDLTSWGVVGGTLVGLLAYELAVYVWHRAMHGSPVLWRSFHQMHHSAERVDTYGAFYFSPLDMLGWTLLGSLVLAFGIGVVPQAATAILLITTFLGMFQHTNIETPRWLGYLIQRPESHAVHHARGIHAYNYSDLPVFDLLFGTFRNPARCELPSGFYAGASARIWEMLTFRDVSQPKRQPDVEPMGASPQIAA